MKTKLKLYIFNFQHWRTKEQTSIDIDAENQFEALAEFKKLFGKVQLKDCTILNSGFSELKI